MGKVILIVEDDVKNLKLLRDILQFHGYSILEASDGSQAIALAIKHKPDLIIMDMQLPVVDGFEATRRIKSDESVKKIPIVACTALAMPEEKKRINEAGCDGYIQKPIDLTKFLLQIEKYLKADRQSSYNYES